MSEPNSPSDPTPAIPPAPTSPPAPSFTYGEAAPAQPAPPVGQPAPAYGVPAYGTPVYGTPVPPKGRRTWDLVLTIILLVVGFFGMLGGIGAAIAFNDPAFYAEFNRGLAQQGISASVDFRAFGTVVVVSHIALYVVALGLGILLLVKRKIAFYVPLAAGVVAAIIFWAGYFVVIFGAIDPATLS